MDAWPLALVHRGCWLQAAVSELFAGSVGQEVFYGQTLPTCVYLVKGTVYLMPTVTTGTLLTFKSHIRAEGSGDVSFLHTPMKEKFAVHFLLMGTQFLPNLSG